MKFAIIFFILNTIGLIMKEVNCTCVLDSSELGISFICKFKKTGLFRVRNLGGIQAHIDLGFEAADAIRFKNSYANTDLSAKRSIQNHPKIPKEIKRNNMIFNLTTVPPFKPIPNLSSIGQFKTDNLLDRRNDNNSHNNRNSAAVSTAASELPTSQTKLSNTSIRILESAILSHQQQKQYDQFKTALKIAKNPDSNFDLNPIADEIPSESKQVPLMPLSNRRSGALDMIATDGDRRPVENPLLMPDPKPAQNFSTDFLNDILAASLKNKKPLENPSASSKAEMTRKHFINSFANFNVIMNAPREYYPFGYDKNFDDNFQSRIELPKTAFQCGNQKHFPGLYANEEFGCMVFHVCALTDDGLIMKSFLCPESTLFDQSILKCNWWFYVDCKKSANLYDANIPISKSYQLMKALTFFSSYKNDDSSSSTNENIDTSHNSDIISSSSNINDNNRE